MSNSKPVAPFVFDVLCYLNRDQLERFSIVCRSLKNIIERYFHSKPHRIFDRLYISRGKYALSHNGIQWHPNRDDYSVQQFLDGQECSSVLNISSILRYYSFAEMLPYLGPNIRIKNIFIHVAASAYNPDHIAEMESITYLWSDGRIEIWDIDGCGKRIAAEDFLPILNSPTILQCRELMMINADFSFKNYNVLYSVKVIEIDHTTGDIDANHYLDFLEKPGVKPVVALYDFSRRNVDNVLDLLSEDFSSATVPNAFKIVFERYKIYQPLTEFRETNNTSGEKLELKKGAPVEYQHRFFKDNKYWTLERAKI
ncbi:hypothetical protein DdX_15515 [Ditylenchus destructor]|uniref:F-box domain-containing protein n=1 Tax=Ditylenchus destructor TaxID=166010 RepID=A0AAD4R0T1_9BILA|nr:hypothetical protein DdX_15515 [Ditylenchus destructor]